MIWKEQGNKLKTHLVFRDFNEAFSFMTSVALLAEQLNHHPNWCNVWNTVDIELCTHDAGDLITDKDRDLAVKIEEIYSKFYN